MGYLVLKWLVNAGVIQIIMSIISLSEVGRLHMFVVEHFGVWGVRPPELIIVQLVFAVELWDFHLMILLVQSLSMELFGRLSHIRLEEGVDLSLRFHFLVVGQIISRRKLSLMELY